MNQINENTPVSVTLGVVNAALQYLGQRPYAEVAGLIQAIHGQVEPQLKSLQSPDPEAGADA